MMDNVNAITATTAKITILLLGVRSLSTIEKYPFYFYTHQEKTTNSTYNTYADYPYLPIISFIGSRSLAPKNEPILLQGISGLFSETSLMKNPATPLSARGIILDKKVHYSSFLRS